MTVAAILKHKGYQVFSVPPTMAVADVAVQLNEHRVGAVLVMDVAEQLLGIISERDIVRSLATNGARTLEMTAGQLMTRALHTVTPRTTEEQAMTTMTASRVRHLPVLEGETVLGIISIGDVVKARIMQQDHEVDSLRAYVAGAS